MKIDDWLPAWDAAERHARALPCGVSEAWAALERADFGRPAGVRLLMGLRALPGLLAHRSLPPRPRTLRLRELEALGFGLLAEEPGREIVLGVHGRFWRPAGNLEPFAREAFAGPVPAGLARAVWSFAVEPAETGAARLTTETRVRCGDPASCRKFRAYWLLVRPGSGLIRRWLLAEVAREAARGPLTRSG